MVLALVLVRRGPGNMAEDDDNEPSADECRVVDEDDVGENDEQ